jgi:hypothetical protein
MKPVVDAVGATGSVGSDVRRPSYEAPSMKVMTEADVLIAFQMSATRIGAAGCWWTTCNNSPVEELT